VNDVDWSMRGQYGWPCKACGAERPTENGHDPCIANLPGVQNACCGHGVGLAYAHFTDGRVIRGYFEDTPAGEEVWDGTVVVWRER
jgi:hypothetical protein